MPRYGGHDVEHSTATCLDCGDTIPKGTRRPRQKCDGCKKEAKRLRDKARRSDPEYKARDAGRCRQRYLDDVASEKWGRGECRNCGKGFVRTGPTQTSCSKECGAASAIRPAQYARKLRPRPEPSGSSLVPWAECMLCRRWFVASRGRFRCKGQSCMRSYALWNKYGRYDKLPAVPCVICGEDVVERRGSGRTCSKDCLKKDPEHREALRRGKRKRRAAKRGGKSEKYTSLEIFKRDGWRCHICGTAVQRDAQVPHLKAPTIDHLVPIADGGDDVRSNVATAHFVCNSRRGVRGAAQLLLVG